jgi:hypothetical protein
MIERRFEQWVPLCALISVRGERNAIAWGMTLTVTPEKNVWLDDDELLMRVIENAANEHTSRYGRQPKVIAPVLFCKQTAVRDIAVRLSGVVSNLGQWSEPYTDERQMCYWIFN